jgi:hypothetical protein
MDGTRGCKMCGPWCVGCGRALPVWREDLTPQAIIELQKTAPENTPDEVLKPMDDINPKDSIGKAKVNLSLVSGLAIAHEAHAMMDGAKKYGPYNWRRKKVSAEVYVSAALRHIEDYYNGEDIASDSKAHHLGHARACLGIILDATETGNLIDDRPPSAPISKLLEHLNMLILETGLHLPKKEKK